MIIKFDQFESKLKSSCNCNSFLFYGPNLGRIDDCTNLITHFYKRDNDLEVINLHTDDLKKEDLLKIFLECNSPNLFNNKVVISIYLNNEKISKELITTLSNLNEGNLIVVVRGDQIGPKSIVRTFFEQNETSMSVPCYEENQVEKFKLISDFINKEKAVLQDSEIKILCQILPDQRLEIKNELEKIIILLKCFGKNIADDYMYSCIPDSINNDQTKFIFSVGAKNTKNFIREYNKFTNFGSDDIKLISFLLEHFFRLMSVKHNILDGFTMQEAIRRLRPPIFFKNIKNFERQLSELEVGEINKVVKNLFMCKKNLIDGKWSSSYSLLNTLFIFFRPEFFLKNS